MKDIAPLAIPATTLCRLLPYADAFQAERCADELAAIAFEEWLARVDGTSAAGIHLRGFQWKELFLPDGAQLCA